MVKPLLAAVALVTLNQSAIARRASLWTVEFRRLSIKRATPHLPTVPVPNRAAAMASRRVLDRQDVVPWPRLKVWEFEVITAQRLFSSRAKP